jgi:hypothetical protein
MQTTMTKVMRTTKTMMMMTMMRKRTMRKRSVA